VIVIVIVIVIVQNGIDTNKHEAQNGKYQRREVLTSLIIGLYIN